MIARHIWSPLIYTLVFGAGTCTLFTRAHQAASREKDATAQEAFPTAKQILEKSRPICEAVAPEGETLQMSAQSAPGIVTPVWDVVCTNRHGYDIVSLRWNAATGELISAAMTPMPMQGSEMALTSSREALSSAESWLDLLGFTGRDRRWHLSCTSYRSPEAMWIVECTSAKHRVVLNLAARSGMLHYAMANYPGIYSAHRW